MYVIDKRVDMKDIFMNNSLLPDDYYITADYFSYKEFDYIEDQFV